MGDQLGFVLLRHVQIEKSLDLHGLEKQDLKINHQRTQDALDTRANLRDHQCHTISYSSDRLFQRKCRCHWIKMVQLVLFNLQHYLHVIFPWSPDILSSNGFETSIDLPHSRLY